MLALGGSAPPCQTGSCYSAAVPGLFSPTSDFTIPVGGRPPAATRQSSASWCRSRRSPACCAARAARCGRAAAAGRAATGLAGSSASAATTHPPESASRRGTTRRYGMPSHLGQQVAAAQQAVRSKTSSSPSAWGKSRSYCAVGNPMLKRRRRRQRGI
eukprot:9487219-Pyramimonas_sp.AAC.1